MPPEPRPIGEDAPAPRGVRLTYHYGADPKRAAEALVELLLSKRRRRPGAGNGDPPARRPAPPGGAPPRRRQAEAHLPEDPRLVPTEAGS